MSEHEVKVRRTEVIFIERSIAGTLKPLTPEIMDLLEQVIFSSVFLKH